MKKLLLVLLLVPLVVAQPADWFDAAKVTVELNVSSTIDIVPSGPEPLVEKLTADVLFVPKNAETVAVRSLDAFPSARVSGDRARFEWQRPSGEIRYGYRAVVEQVNAHPLVRAKIPFPVDVPRELEQYVVATQHIDAKNQAIVENAKELAEGEDDLFALVGKVGAWTKNNIEYNLSTLTADISQPASWVLQNRQGVCDELTSLFIAMLRSLGVPARFVSGLTFTNNPAFPAGWGAHGWAEVYFPGVGWVPFDPTFGELGWVDPGHVKLKESNDPQEPTTVFEWRSRDVKVNVHDLELSAAVVGVEGRVPSVLDVDVSPFRSRTAFGSFNGVMAEVENQADYYVAPELTLTRVKGLRIVGGESRQVVLPPHGRDRVFWVVQVEEGFDPGFQYEIPLKVYTMRGEEAKSSFAVGTFETSFSEEDVASEIDRLTVSATDPFDVACAFARDHVWEDTAELGCSVQSRQGAMTVDVCFDDCQTMQLPAGGSVPLSFDVPVPIPGPHEAKVVVKGGGVEKRAVLTVVRMDEPRVAVKNVKAPEVVQYGERFTVSFLLSRESVSFPQNTVVEMGGGGASAVVDVGELMVDQEVAVTVDSGQLYSASPDFDIDVLFEDVQGRSYRSSAGVSVRVEGVPWWKKAIGWFIDWF